MDLRGSIIRLFQKTPISWRQGIVAAPIAPIIRCFLNRFYGDQTRIFSLRAPLEGHRMRLHWQTQKAFFFGLYEPEVTKTIQQVVHAGIIDGITVDIGAHIGYYTLLLAKHANGKNGKNGKVVAFEPLPENFEVLKENVALNSYHNVVVENKAVADFSGRITIARNNDVPLTSTASISPNSITTSTSIGLGTDVIEVDVVKLDDYFDNCRQRVAFLKMDVEGAETAVLDGMKRILSEDRPLLLIELHGFDIYGDQHPALLKLKEAGYTCRYLGAPGAQRHVLAEPN